MELWIGTKSEATGVELVAKDMMARRLCSASAEDHATGLYTGSHVKRKTYISEAASLSSCPNHRPSLAHTYEAPDILQDLRL